MFKSITRFVFILFVAAMSNHAAAQDNKYPEYQRALQIQNDTLKCRALIKYATHVVDSLHDYDFSLRIYEKINTILKGKNYEDLNFALYCNWGLTNYKKGNYVAADKLYLKAFDYKLLDKQPERKLNLLNWAAVNAECLSANKRALNYYNEALEICIKSNDEKSKALVYQNMAYIYAASGNYTQALSLLSEAEKLCLKNNMPENYSELLANRAFIKYELKQLDSSTIFLNRAISHLTKKGRANEGYVKMCASLATGYAELKKWDSSFYFLDRAKHVIDSMNLSESLNGGYYNAMAYCYDLKGDVKKSVYYYKQALKVKTGINRRFLYENIADVYMNAKQYDSAFYYKNETMRFVDSIYASELKEHVTFENKRIDLLEKDYEEQIHSVEQQHSMQQLEKKNYLLLSAILVLVIGVLLFLLYFRQYRLRIKKEHLQSELDFLKAQLNPHFLFNSINNIYVLLDENKEKASEILIKFSELMRYQLYECNTAAILLYRELQFLENYTEFEKLRYSNKITAQYTTNVTASNQLRIAPLLLQPFIENAFKHTPKKKDQQNCIEISASIDGYEFLFEVRNTLRSEKASELPGGIGLKNVKKRLKLLYPGKHDLKILKTDQLYTVILKITLSHD